MYKLNPVQVPGVKNDMNLHCNIYSFSILLQILSEKNINYLTINDSFSPRIVDPSIFKRCLEIKYEPLVICDQYMISFVTRKNIIVLCNASCVNSMDI